MKRIVFDYSNLRGEIKKKYNKLEDLASDIGLCPSTLSTKLANGTSFSNEQISKIVKCLSLSLDTIPLLFFVQKLWFSQEFFFKHNLNNKEEHKWKNLL